MGIQGSEQSPKQKERLERITRKKAGRRGSVIYKGTAKMCAKCRYTGTRVREKVLGIGGAILDEKISARS